MGIRVVNLRSGALTEYQRDPEETLVYGDRRSLVLGNPYPMRDRTEAERQRVIGLFRQRLDADWEVNGPIYRQAVALAQRVRSGEQLALGCWCAPKACHLDHVLAKVQELL